MCVMLVMRIVIVVITITIFSFMICACKDYHTREFIDKKNKKRRLARSEAKNAKAAAAEVARQEGAIARCAVFLGVAKITIPPHGVPAPLWTFNQRC